MTAPRAMLFISIHALRKESDDEHHHSSADDRISIHALRKESDLTSIGGLYASGNFNPRSP